LRENKYRNRHKNSTIAICGGGPSLPKDLKKVPYNAIKISINDHAALNYNCKYMCFLDDYRNLSEDRVKAFESFKGVKISKLSNLSDVKILPLGYWRGAISGVLACWWADFVGAKNIIICGCDCYTSDKTYYHTDKYKTPECAKLGVDYNIQWWKPVKEKRPDIYAVSGPLLEMFEKWQ
jgi:hypothetical protein